MDKLFIGLILGLLPVISYFLHYIISVKHKKVESFKKFIPVSYLDWIFVPFNIAFVYVVNINYNLLISIIIIFPIGNFLVHYYVYSRHLKMTKYIYQFGIMHLVYSSIQGIIMLIFLFSRIESNLIYFLSALIVLYFIGMIKASIILHKKADVFDVILCVSGIIVVLVKLILFI